MNNPAGDSLGFHHVHMYVDDLKPLAHYKDLEATFSNFSAGLAAADKAKGAILAGQQVWEQQTGNKANPEAFQSAGQDVVEQMIAGLGWRVTAEAKGPSTYSLLVSSPDATGAKFVVTSKQEGEGKEELPHFSASNVQRFYDCHAGRAGIAVLAFECHTEGGVDEIAANYKAKHSALLVHDVKTYENGAFKVLEVFAYYCGKDNTKADEGTILRFVERSGAAANVILPGFNAVEASYPADAFPAFSDHWVSNVINRKQFLETLNDTLGFTPKVDFNAGVVAAGQAIIESTVTGNTAPLTATSKEEILLNQQQVYLPINNALSDVGHVALFIDEVGQGIQHIASRVKDLVSFIARTNAYREMTGKGLSFLRIPRSYYGRLELAALEREAGCSNELAKAVVANLQKIGLVSVTGITKLDITEAEAARAGEGLEGALAGEFAGCAEGVVAVVLRSRYSNLVKLLKDHLSEATYLKIVENAILVDIQAGDVLYQIFTANILQRVTGEEAPFLEFIQRVCSEKLDEKGNPQPIRPGCGGFGIRNFLTLFLSIEVSKAMLMQDTAVANGDAAKAAIAAQMVELFTQQLDESNPVLTQISDAMTAEADALVAAECCAGDAAQAERRAQLLTVVEEERAKKNAGQQALKDISERYAAEMGKLRQQ